MTYFDKLVKSYTQRQIQLAYNRWFSMKSRCYNKSNPAYENYGGRGIKVCDRWLGEDGFYNYVMDIGMPKKGESLDRINNNLGYSPDNCRWTSSYEQRQNQRRTKEREKEGLPAGVSYDASPDHKRRKHWLARLEVNGKRVLNKRFMTKDEAINARLAAEKEFL